MMIPFEGMVCNEEKKISKVKVLARIKIQDYEFETLAIVDSRCTKSILNSRFLPLKLIKKLSKTSTIHANGRNP